MTYPDRPVFTGPVYGAPVGPPARPGIVSAAFFAALASGLFSVIGGILEFSGARELAAIVLGALVMAASLTVHNAALWAGSSPVSCCWSRCAPTVSSSPTWRAARRPRSV